MNEDLLIKHIKGNEFQFERGNAVAYGTLEWDTDMGTVVGSLDHAPSQEWYDHVSEAPEWHSDAVMERKYREALAGVWK